MPARAIAEFSRSKHDFICFGRGLRSHRVNDVFPERKRRVHLCAERRRSWVVSTACVRTRSVASTGASALEAEVLGQGIVIPRVRMPHSWQHGTRQLSAVNATTQIVPSEPERTSRHLGVYEQHLNALGGGSLQRPADGLTFERRFFTTQERRRAGSVCVPKKGRLTRRDPSSNPTHAPQLHTLHTVSYTNTHARQALIVQSLDQEEGCGTRPYYCRTSKWAFSME